MIERRERLPKRTPATIVKVRGIPIPPALVRWGQAMGLLPPVKSNREGDRVRRIAYL